MPYPQHGRCAPWTQAQKDATKMPLRKEIWASINSVNSMELTCSQLQWHVAFSVSVSLSFTLLLNYPFNQLLL